MENFECHTHIVMESYKLDQPGTALDSPPLMASLQSDHVLLDFHWQTKHRYSYISFPGESPLTPQHIVNDEESTNGSTSRTVDRLAFLNDDVYSRRLVDELIFDYSSPRTHHMAVDWIVTEARKLLRERQDCKTVLLDLRSVRIHLCFENALVRDVLNRSLQDYGGGMKPASQSSLELLKKVDLEDEGSLPDCMVCLGDLKEMEVLCMPCSHMFHGECILEWLKNSHFCPICRYELPMDL